MSPEVGALVEQYAMFKLPEFVEQLSNPEFEPSETDRIPSSASKKKQRDREEESQTPKMAQKKTKVKTIISPFSGSSPCYFWCV
jgi:hypothetical protein